MKDEPQTHDAERPNFALQTKLHRLRCVKEELREEGLPIPPELNEKIQEVRLALGYDWAI